MNKSKPISFSISLLHPKFWLTWLAIVVWWVFVQLTPFKVQMWLGKCLGIAFLKYVKSRTRVAKVNIDLCFPELSDSQRQELLKKQMISVGRGFFDTGIAWFWPAWRLRRIVEVKGLDHLEKANSDGQGILFLGLHFTSLELTSVGINRNTDSPITGVYRAHNNKVYDWVQRYGRERHSQNFQTIPKQDVRGMMKCLRAGRVLSYLPDQDYGPKHSVFVPFCGVQTATVTATTQLAKTGKAKTLAYFGVRNTDATGYEVHIYPELPDFGTLGVEQDATLMNKFIEQRVKEFPDQYLWVHRRFKTRPEGEKSVY